ncbi:MAG: IS5 family transposase [Mycobacterium sp.]
MPDHPRRGRPCPPQRWREYLDAILYVLRTGCAWRHLPHDFTVGWSAAHKHFMRWCRSGLWTRILAAIRGEARTRAGRGRRPTAAVVDSSSVKASPVAGPRGFDGAKKVDGVKRHILVDSGGILVPAVVTPANMQDRAAFPQLLRKAKRVAPTIAHIWLDKGYTGVAVADAAAKAGVTVDIVSGPKPGHGFIVQPRRWVVERTNGWINHCRRLDRHYEITLTAHEGFLMLSQIALLLRRLDRSQLFDTL